MSAEYEMVMPFVTTQDNGGTHDDVSYVCGFEMGHFDAKLATCQALGWTPKPIMIHTVNQPQADLIAMKHGFVAEFEPIEGYEQWTVCGFERASSEPEDGEA